MAFEEQTDWTDHNGQGPAPESVRRVKAADIKRWERGIASAHEDLVDRLHSRGVYFPSGDSMLRWRTKANEVLRGVGQGHIAVLADSIGYGAGATGNSLPKYASSWPGQLRSLIEAQTGPAGTGIVAAAKASFENPAYDPRWKFGAAVSPYTFGWHRESSYRITSGTPEGYLEFTADCDEFIVYGLSASQGVNTAFIDGKRAGTFRNIGGAPTVDFPMQAGYSAKQIVSRIPVPSGRGIHTLRIETDNSATGRDAHIVAIEGRINTPGTFRISNHGFNGRSLSTFGAKGTNNDEANTLLGLPMLDLTQADLLVLALGINDWQGGADIAGQKAALELVIDRQRSNGTNSQGGKHPNGDVILLWNAKPNIEALAKDPVLWEQYRDLYYQVAREKDVPLVDISAVWSQDFAISNGLGLFGDTIHPSDKGSADIAKTVLRAILDLSGNARRSEASDDRAVEVPAAIGWDMARYPVTMTVTEIPGRLRPHGECSLTPEAAFDAATTARTTPGTSLYVDSATGNNSAAGTSAAPLKSISKAIELANAAGKPAKIWIKGGTYGRADNFTNIGAAGPSVDTAFIAYQGRVTVTVHDNFTATAHATYPRVYTVASVTASTVNRVMDLTSKTLDGGYVELLAVASIEACAETPGSWFHAADGTLAIHRHDGGAATQDNTRYYRAQTRVFSCMNAVNLYFGGASGNEGFDLEGGSSLGAIDVRPTALAATPKVLAISNLSARYAGGKVDSAAPRGVSVDNWYGLIICKGVDASFNQTDGFNVHNTLGAPWSGILTINCDAIDNGRSGGQSCNGHTLHENVVGIDLCSRLERGHGGTVRNIGTSKALYAGTYVAYDQGDKATAPAGSAGTVGPSAIRIDENAQAWFDRARTMMGAGEYEYVAGAATAKIFKRNTWPTRSPDQGVAASFATY